jgi:hypothetical protein
MHFSTVIWFIFNLQNGKEKWLGIYVHNYKVLWLFFLHIALLDMVILELLVCGWCWCELVHPVPMLTVNWSCHSLLLVELFIGTVRLGCPYLGAWLRIFGSTYVHTLLRNGLSYCMYTARQVTNTYMLFITLILLLARVSWTCCCQPLLSGTITLNPYYETLP